MSGGVRGRRQKPSPTRSVFFLQSLTYRRRTDHFFIIFLTWDDHTFNSVFRQFLGHDLVVDASDKACRFLANVASIDSKRSCDFRMISGNPRQFNYRDESVELCISAHGNNIIIP